MTEKSVFISSCSRRQLWRRRPGRTPRRPLLGPRAAWRYTLPSAAVTALAGFAAYVAGRGGL